MLGGMAKQEPFEHHVVDDVVRLTLLAMVIFLILVCVRVAWLRFRTPREHRRPDESPLALLSYALFASIPTINGLNAFGQPLTWRVFLYGAALTTGVAACFRQVTITRWWGWNRSHQKRGPQ